jgi:hypothetical protein
MALRIGYAQEIITPTLGRPVYLAGFGQNRRAQTVHDDLYVRALALQRGHTRLVVVALDLIGLGRPHCQQIEQRLGERAPGTRLWLSSTHTHHGPDTIGLWGPDLATSGVDPAYLHALQDKVVATALAALRPSLYPGLGTGLATGLATGLGTGQPAHLRCVSLPVTGLAKNARDPEILDEELTCLQFCQPETAAPLATWLIYPCHPEVLGEHNPHITADYPHALRRAVEAETGAPCLFMPGAMGGMMTPDVEDHSFEEAEEIGRALAQAALEALELAAAAPVDGLELARHEYTIPLTNPLFQMAMGAGLLPSLVDGAGEITTQANLLKLGPAWLLGVPGELLPKLGLAFKAAMRRAGAGIAAITGLTNDELGYILPPEDFVYPENPFAPGSHYEETMSIGPEAGSRLQEALGILLGQAATSQTAT